MALRAPSSFDPPSRPSRGPVRADHFVSGDPYEVSNGHAVHCLPTGGRGSQPNRLGASVVGWDPAVREAGVDTGYSPEPGTLRAPDVAVGNVPDEPGWVKGAPDLAIEYADVGQDEESLAAKVDDLMRAGTKFLWVVRLTGPRRVDVYEPGKPMRTVEPGGVLTAPGVLENPVRVEALYDRDEAERATLTNLLQRRGFESLDAVLVEGRRAGLVDARRSGIRDLCEVLGIALDEAREAELSRMSLGDLEGLRDRIKRERRW